MKHTIFSVSIFASLFVLTVAFSKTSTADIIVVQPSTRETPIQNGASVEDSSGEGSEEDSEGEEDKPSAEDELVAKLIEIQFSRTPESILKAWSDERREADKSADDKVADDKATEQPIAQTAKVVNQFGDVLILATKSDSILTPDAVVTVAVS